MFRVAANVPSPAAAVDKKTRRVDLPIVAVLMVSLISFMETPGLKGMR
jgi:hypothetical protein